VALHRNCDNGELLRIASVYPMVEEDRTVADMVLVQKVEKALAAAAYMKRVECRGRSREKREIKVCSPTI
jgi:hypothetical protein